VMLAREHWAEWLARDVQDPALLAPLLRPAPPGTMQAWPVSRAVNKGSAEGEALILPIDVPPPGQA
jgi:putative SOS response-associated peptidase YedK